MTSKNYYYYYVYYCNASCIYSEVRIMYYCELCTCAPRRAKDRKSEAKRAIERRRH